MTDTQYQDVALVDSPAFVKWWPWGWKIVLVVAVGAFGRFASQTNDAHKAKLKEIESTPVALPELVTPKPVKPTAKKVADKVTNTPAIPVMVIPATVAEPETQFDRDLINFESKL